MEMSIRFPGIDLVLPYVPRAFWIFGMEFTIYGVLIAAGALLGMRLVLLEAGRNQEDPNKYLDMMLISLAASVLGSRLFYVIFSWGLYSENLKGIFDLRNGGYVFYGGLLAAVIAAAVFCRLTDLSFLKMADNVTPGILLGQVIGRWGNFFNRESFGEYTEWITAMQIPVSAVRSGEVSGTMRDNLLTINGTSYIQVQPVFLYESIWCLILLLVILAIRRRKRFDGELFMRYLAGYGLGRFFFEWMRTDKLCFPGTKVGISLVISAALFLIFAPSVIVQRVMAKKRADIRRISRERAYLEEKKFHLALELRRRKNADESEQDPEHTADSKKNKENPQEMETQERNTEADKKPDAEISTEKISDKLDISYQQDTSDKQGTSDRRDVRAFAQNTSEKSNISEELNNWEDSEYAHISENLRHHRTETTPETEEPEKEKKIK